MNIIEIFIYGMAIWRVSSLFVREDGPFFVFRRIREKAGIVHDENGEAFMIPDGLFSGILSCIYCASIWASFFLTAFWLISPEWSLKFSVPFAFSGIAILLDVAIKRMKM